MTERSPPSLDLIVLCSHIEFDGNKQPFALQEPLHTVLLEPDENGQLSAPELMLYVQMTDEDAQGTYRFRVEVRSESNIVLRELRDVGIDVTFTSRVYPMRPFEHVFVIRGVVFPAPGVYHFHVMCGLASMSDRPNATRPAKLRVVQAERGEG